MIIEVVVRRNLKELEWHLQDLQVGTRNLTNIQLSPVNSHQLSDIASGFLTRTPLLDNNINPMQ